MTTTLCRVYNDNEFLNGPLQDFRETVNAENIQNNPPAAEGEGDGDVRQRPSLEVRCGCRTNDGRSNAGNEERNRGCIMKDSDCSFLEALDPLSQIPVQLNEIPWSLVAKANYIPWCSTESYTCYPQHLASLFGQKDLAKMMFETKAADVHARDIQGNTTLMLAAASGFARTMVPFLLLMCKDEDMRKELVTAKNVDGLTALHFAALCDDPQVVELLLEQGADVNAGQFMTSQNRHFALTPLHFALVKAKYPAASIAELLIQSGADLSLEAATGDCSEHHATFVNECSCGICWSQELSVLPNLLLPSYGACYDGEITSVGTALHIAVKRGVDLSSILSEAQHGMLLNIPDGSCYLPLHTAVKNLNQKTIKIVLSLGADVNAPVKGNIYELGNTALHMLFRFKIATMSFYCNTCLNTLQAKDRFHKCVSLLLQHPSVNVNAKNAEGITPLHVACEGGHYAYIEQLVACGANVLVMDNEGRTPLSCAARPIDRATREKVVDVLLRCGAALSCLNRPVFEIHSPVQEFFGRYDINILLKLHRIGAMSSEVLNKLLYLIMVIMSQRTVEMYSPRDELLNAAMAAYQPNGCSPRSLFSQSLIFVSRHINPGTPQSRREAFMSLEVDHITLEIIQDLGLM